MTSSKPKKKTAPPPANRDAAEYIRETEQDLRAAFEERRQLGYGTHSRRHRAPEELTARIRRLTERLRVLKAPSGGLRKAAGEA